VVRVDRSTTTGHAPSAKRTLPGTSRLRPASSADLAAAANPQSYILPPATFVELFDEALPQIVSGS
jgi:hypothetical protein